ncbi:hypothetical protein LSH36_364g06007 [Paralvinella palmiformis]|uniref:Uncharacterized protein n=1 Tax=Paralvinella palmiformis TaxID=53620 RepID=A0AAD9JE11_9ANNE|nr:hypothetical protein LSH36_364g06007 [Paralvinella palmiformis]
MAQVSGAIAGAALLLPTLDGATYTSIGGGTPTLGPNVSILRGLLMEAVLTFILVLVILLAAVDKRLMCAPLAIGSALIVSILAGGPISGAAVNPVVAFGPAVILSTESTSHWNDHWLYWVGAVLGSVVAALSFRFILASVEKRTVCRDKDNVEK